MSLIFGKEAGHCTGLDRVDQISISNREEPATRYQATTLTLTPKVLTHVGNLL